MVNPIGPLRIHDLFEAYREGQQHPDINHQPEHGDYPANPLVGVIGLAAVGAALAGMYFISKGAGKVDGKNEIEKVTKWITR
jgi:uncharacterized protein (UPF0264 family)